MNWRQSLIYVVRKRSQSRSSRKAQFSYIQKHARQAQGTFTSHMLVSMLFPTGKLPAKTRYRTQEVGEAPAKKFKLQIPQTCISFRIVSEKQTLWAKGRTTLTGRFLDFTPCVAAIAVENDLAGISARLSATRLSKALSKRCSSCTRDGAHRPILIQRVSILQQHRI